jgi:hypothetical protein
VAVGPGPAAWTSTRGGPWSWAPDQTTLTFGEMRAVAVGPFGITAAGRDRCEPGIDCLVAWRSRDGLSWSRTRLHDTLPDDEVVAVLARDEGAIVIGRSQSREGIGTVVWVGAPLFDALDR